MYHLLCNSVIRINRINTPSLQIEPNTNKISHQRYYIQTMSVYNKLYLSAYFPSNKSAHKPIACSFNRTHAIALFSLRGPIKTPKLPTVKKNLSNCYPIKQTDSVDVCNFLMINLPLLSGLLRVRDLSHCWRTSNSLELISVDYKGEI